MHRLHPVKKKPTKDIKKSKNSNSKISKLFAGFKNQGFLTGAITLAAAGIICRLLGIAFRIPLANIIQNYGMGLYQMVFPLYALLLVISSAGIPIAISKLIAQRDAGPNMREDSLEKIKNSANKKDSNKKTNTRKDISTCTKHSGKKCYPANQILANSLVLLGGLGLVISTALIGLAHPIAKLQGNPDIAKIYMAIAPAIFFVCLIAAFRGYFQGLRNMIPTASSQIVEQVVKVGAGLTLAITLHRFGVYWAVFGAILAVTISEVLALGYLVVVYLVHKKRTGRLTVTPTHEKPSDYQSNDSRTKSSRYISWSLIWLIIKKSFPITLMASVFPLILVFDSLVVVRMLTDLDTSSTIATQLYGISSGTVHTLINMPAILGIAIGTAVVPMTAALLKKGDTEQFKKKSALAIKLGLVITAFFALFYIAFARQIILVLYESAFRDNPTQLQTATNLLKIESAMILLMGLSQILTSMLQGAGRAKWPLIAILIGGTAKIAFQMSLIRTGLGIYAVSIGNVICFGVVLALNIIFVAKFLKLRPAFTHSVWKLGLIFLGLSGILVGLMFGLPDNKWWVILSGFIAVSLYALSIWLLRVFNPRKQ